jgi:hypothetical protein
MVAAEVADDTELCVVPSLVAAKAGKAISVIALRATAEMAKVFLNIGLFFGLFFCRPFVYKL